MTGTRVALAVLSVSLLMGLASQTALGQTLAVGPGPRKDPSSRKPGDPPPSSASFQAPEFPSSPRPIPIPGRPRSSRPVARVELTYWKQTGNEQGPWTADLYLPGGADVLGSSAFETASGPRVPLIVVLPIGGIRKDLRSFFARRFAKRGFAVLALGPLPPESGAGILHSLKGTARTLSEDVANLRRILAWASRLPSIDSKRIGIMGVSRGAIGTALAAQIEPGLSTVLVLGGADLAGLFRDSHLHIVESMRTEETTRTGSLEKALEKAQHVLRDVDPGTRQGRIDPTLTTLINARWDHVIPREQALALRRTAGNATQYWLPAGHYGSLLLARCVRRIALSHFERTLGPVAPPSPL